MWQRFKSWFRADSGVVAVEFALLAIPFTILTVGLIETALFFAAGIILEGGAADAARIIRTGQVQVAADPEQMFEDKLCDKVSALIPCEDLQYEVIAMQPNTFLSAEQMQPQFDANGDLIPLGFDAGASRSVVLVRAVYKYEFLTPFLGAMMTGDPTKNWALHMSTVVIKNEPFRING